MRSISIAAAAAAVFASFGFSSTPASGQPKFTLGSEQTIYVYCTWMQGDTTRLVSQVERIEWRDGIKQLEDGRAFLETNIGSYVNSLEREFKKRGIYADCHSGPTPDFSRSYYPGMTYPRHGEQRMITVSLAQIDPRWFVLDGFRDNARVAALDIQAKRAEISSKDAPGSKDRSEKAPLEATNRKPSTRGRSESATALPEKHAREEAEERARNEAEERRRLEAERKSKAKVDALYAEQLKQAQDHIRGEKEKIALIERQQREAEMRAAAFERALAEQRRIDAEYKASMARHEKCVGGDQQACEDIRQGAPLKVLETNERASTDDDPRRCVAAPVVSPSNTFKGQTQAVVVNGCEKPVDVRICLLRAGGWNCGVNWGIRPQDKWTHTSFNALGDVYWDARYTGTTVALRSPN